MAQPVMNTVAKHSRDTPLQTSASWALSLSPSFRRFMMYPPNTMPTPALGTMIKPATLTPTHTPTHVHTHTHTRTRTSTHTHTHTPPRTLTLTLTLTHTNTNTNTHT